MGIMTRITRLCKADIHGVMDQLEDKELILKQCLREMENSLNKKMGKLNHLKAAYTETKNKTDQLHDDREKIEQDLKTAIEKEKDDIARLLIKKLKKTEQHLKNYEYRMESIENQLTALKENIKSQKHQYAEMQLRSESWLQKIDLRKWNESISSITPESSFEAIPDEEIELELIKRKEAIKGGELR